MATLDMFSLVGKKGFITGAAQGIGKCLAENFADAGADVAVVDINLELAKKTAAEIAAKSGRMVRAYKCDVTDAADAAALMKAYLKDFKTIDFAVNNAGIATFDNAMDIDPETFKRVIDVNLIGVFNTAQAAARVMKEQGTGGSIISTASMSAHIINVPQTIANYCASKAGVMHLSKALAVEWAQYNIRVNTVSPGYIQTELVASLTDMLPVWKDKMPDGSRLGYPEDLVGAYIYLASDASKFATGADFVVDGGYTIL
jgi:NAD(P)-dependent dehydrogenase (short-subunit alcohol dehydrogenase family)